MNFPARHILTASFGRLLPSALLLASALFLFTPGCVTGRGDGVGVGDDHGNVTPQAVAYFTLADLKTLVDGAERLYGDAVAAGKVTPAQERDTDEKIVRFHAAFKLAVRGARTNYQARAPDDLRKLADALVGTIKTFAR